MAETELRLRGMLLRAVSPLDPQQVARTKYERSTTEQGITSGALEAEREQVFCYLRTIEELPEDERASDFRDLREGTPDPEGTTLLGHLKGRLRQELPHEHGHEYQAQWHDLGLTRDHLTALCERVEADLSGRSWTASTVGPPPSLSPLLLPVWQDRMASDHRE